MYNFKPTCGLHGFGGTLIPDNDTRVLWGRVMLQHIGFEGAHVEAIGKQPKEWQGERHSPVNSSGRRSPARLMIKFLLINKVIKSGKPKLKALFVSFPLVPDPCQTHGDE